MNYIDLALNRFLDQVAIGIASDEFEDPEDNYHFGELNRFWGTGYYEVIFRAKDFNKTASFIEVPISKVFRKIMENEE